MFKGLCKWALVLARMVWPGSRDGTLPICTEMMLEDMTGIRGSELLKLQSTSTILHLKMADVHY